MPTAAKGDILRVDVPGALARGELRCDRCSGHDPPFIAQAEFHDRRVVINRVLCSECWNNHYEHFFHFANWFKGWTEFRVVQSLKDLRDWASEISLRGKLLDDPGPHP